MLLSSASGPCLHGRLSSNVRAQTEPPLQAESSMKAFTNPSVERVFAAYPPAMRKKLLTLRELILRTAAETEGVGELEETLKWGEPAYLTSSTASGSTIRIDWKKKRPNEYAMYFNCQTTLVETFRLHSSRTTSSSKAIAPWSSARQMRSQRMPWPSASQVHSPITEPPSLAIMAESPRLRPNPSLEPTRSGKAHWPPRAQYYVAPVGQWALPPRSAQLKR